MENFTKFVLDKFKIVGIILSNIEIYLMKGLYMSYIEQIGFPQEYGKKSSVKFTIQSGPIKEYGINGCQIDDVISWAKEKIEEFQKAFPCRENAIVITKLDEALLWLMKRKIDRELRKVEGLNKV